MDKQTGKKRVSFKRILPFLFLGAAIVLAAVAGWQFYQKNRAKGQEEAVKKETVKETSEDYDEELYEKTGQKFPKRDIDWEALKAQNEDVYAWIWVPGTDVDYPVLQKEGSDDYYLEHNLDKSSGYPGCIYSQSSYNPPDFSDNHTVLYGHDMKDGSMFATLHRFEDEAFFEQNRYIICYMPEETYAYEIFAAYTFTDAHLLATYDCTDRSNFGNYLGMVKNINTQNAHLIDDLSGVDATKRILTLSTCISYAPSNRWLVQGVELQ